MKYSDVNIYVIRQNFTNKEMVSNFNALYTSNDLDLNLIVNDISKDRSNYGYGYGYVNTYGYGYYEEDLNNIEKKPWWKNK